MDGDALVVRARSIALDTGRVQGRRHRARTAARTVRDVRTDRAPHGARPRRPRRPTSKSSTRRWPSSKRSSRDCSPRRRRRRSAICAPRWPDSRRSIGRASRCGTSTRSRAITRWRSPPSTSVGEDSPWFRRARFLAGLSQLNLKKYDDAFATFKALADVDPSPALLNNLGVVQLRRGGTPQGGQPAYFFNKAAEADPRRRRFPVQPRVRVLARSRPAGGDLLAARGGSAQSRRRRCALRARRRADRRQQQRRGDARARAGPPSLGSLRAVRSVRAAMPCPEGSNASSRKSSCRTPADRRAAHERRAAEQRRARALSPRTRPAAVSAGERSRGDRRIEPRDLPLAVPGRRAPSARAVAAPNGTRPRSDRRVQDRAVEHRDGRGDTRRLARPTARPRTSTRRGPKPDARSPSIRRRSTPESCWRESMAARSRSRATTSGQERSNVLKSRWLWRNRSRTKAFTKSS